MIKLGKYLYGTAEEIAKECLYDMINDGQLEFSEKFMFKNCDFTEQFDTDADMLETAKRWHGIKAFDAGFDNPGLDLWADLYGGGEAVNGELYEGMSGDEAVDVVKGMIIGTLSMTDTYCPSSPDDKILAEFLDYRETPKR